VPAAAAAHQLLHHVALLVALHREHALVAAGVAVLGDRPLEGGVQPLKPVFQDVVEADQQRQGEVAPLQLLHQLHQIEAAAAIAAGLHGHVAAGVHPEVGLAPAVDAVKGGALGTAPVAAALVSGGRGAGGIGEHHRTLERGRAVGRI
jgi:hypothetical protein